MMSENSACDDVDSKTSQFSWNVLFVLKNKNKNISLSETVFLLTMG